MKGIILTGPTATGKSELAIAIAQRFSGEIISMDSCLVYRGMDIGSAKPSRNLQNQIKHHLIDTRDPDQQYSAGAFVNDAKLLIKQIISQGKLPIFCGGTMLYCKAILEGLSPIPAVPEHIREELKQQLDEIGSTAMHEKLTELDPIIAKKYTTSDRQRILRALEIFHATGKPMSSWHQVARQPLENLTPFIILLMPAERNKLRKKILQRTDEMFVDGLIDEVAKLVAKHGDQIAALRAVGYRQVVEYLQGKLNRQEVVEKTGYATAQFAKRQLAWLRKLASKADLVIDPFEQDIQATVLERLEREFTSSVTG